MLCRHKLKDILLSNLIATLRTPLFASSFPVSSAWQLPVLGSKNAAGFIFLETKVVAGSSIDPLDPLAGFNQMLFSHPKWDPK